MRRLRSVERRARILEVMAALASRVTNRSEFTAEKVATACGVSTTLMYRLASAEFRAYRAGLSGGRGVDAVVQALRDRLADASLELATLRRIARAHEACPTLVDVTTVVEANERLEEENRSLRVLLERLRSRRSQRLKLD